jgi:deoxyribodipyrimidine photo-lyase
VYTPFSNHCLARISEIGNILDIPKSLDKVTGTKVQGLQNHIDEIRNNIANVASTSWQGKFADWQIGEVSVQGKLQKFLHEKIYNYKTSRDFPGIDGTSKLSPHFHFGEISIRQAFLSAHAVYIDTTNPDEKENTLTYLKELLWREFSYYLLYQFPALSHRSFSEQYDHIQWRDHRSTESKKLLKAWKEGKTGYPIVDAGMRELWATGYMHNRVRMIVASFLIKDLGFDWRIGEEWFWDCLLDADPASNSASWQWVAGSGADAAPYFRVFNPTLQGEKFDPSGTYIRKWVPELQNLPDKYIHSPDQADVFTLAESGVVLGETYARPIIDHKEARNDTLERYAIALRKTGTAKYK